jgi:hypothetical protein
MHRHAQQGQTMYEVSLRESYFPAQHEQPLRETVVCDVPVEAAADVPDTLALLEMRASRLAGCTPATSANREPYRLRDSQ